MKLKHGFTLSWLLILVLFGCNQEEPILPNESQSPLSVMVRGFSGKTIQPEDGLKLGLFTEGEIFNGEEEVNRYISSNFPYTLTNGVLIPDKNELSTSTLEVAKLFAYAPYTGDENITTDSHPFYEDKILNFGIELDQRTHGTASSDLLWGESTYSGKENPDSITLAHKCCKLKINLTSELGNDLSTATVSVLGIFPSLSMVMYSGKIQVSAIDDSSRKDITAFRTSSSTFEVIVPPQTIFTNHSLIAVTIGKETYTHNATQKILQEGKEYTYDIEVKDAGGLPFTVDIKYDGKLLGNELITGYQTSTKSIEMKEKPIVAGDAITYGKLRVRNADGSHCWVQIKNFNNIETDVLYDEIYRCSLIVEENYSSAREMTLEFYNIAFPKFVHKRVLVKQAAASSYFTLSQPSLDMDRWGNIYDFPNELSVQSNQDWQLEKDYPDWITVQGYAPGAKNQKLRISVAENKTGSARDAELRFTAGGNLVKSYPIRQSTIENSSFTLKYDLTLDYSTVDNYFRKYILLVETFYASKIIIFAKYEPNADTAATIESGEFYGFVTDAPTSFNHIFVPNFQSNYFIYKNYTGNRDTLFEVNSSILGPTRQGSQNIFRQINFNLPIPAGVERNQKVKFTVTIKNITDTAAYGTPDVKSQIVDQ